ncbi:MAG: hypothetical protein K9L56_13505 [Clostridiales bacterium]|nr:hypothetical protein [Clostridiales bacterium]
MSRNGFKVVVEVEDKFTEKSLQEAPGDPKYIQNKIPFEFEFDETMKPNFGRITLTNITDKQRQDLKKSKTITMKVSWLPEEENSLLSSNLDVINVHTYVRDNGNTYDTDVIVRDTPVDYHQAIIAKSWDRGESAEAVLNGILDEIEMQGRKISPDSNISYKRGKSFYLPAYQALKQVTSDMEAKLFFFNKKCYVKPANDAFDSSVSFKDKDIIDKSGPISKGPVRKQVTAQFDAGVKPGHNIQLNTEEGGGTFRVYSGKYASKDGTRLYSELNLV